MVFVGDLYQLPPVVTNSEREIFRSVYATPYFFSAMALSDSDLEIVELEKVYRQSDAGFVALLNSVRNDSVGRCRCRASQRARRFGIRTAGRCLLHQPDDHKSERRPYQRKQARLSAGYAVDLRCGDFRGTSGASSIRRRQNSRSRPAPRS